MSADEAIADALSAVREAEAAAALDVSKCEASAASAASQAAEAYQLAIAILQNKQVDLAPALVALEVAAIGEGIAAYLAEEAAALTIERAVAAKAQAARESVKETADAAARREALDYRDSLKAGLASSPNAPDAAAAQGDAPAAVRMSLDAASAAVARALAAAGASS